MHICLYHDILWLLGSDRPLRSSRLIVMFSTTQLLLNNFIILIHTVIGQLATNDFYDDPSASVETMVTSTGLSGILSLPVDITNLRSYPPDDIYNRIRVLKGGYILLATPQNLNQNGLVLCNNMLPQGQVTLRYSTDNTLLTRARQDINVLDASAPQPTHLILMNIMGIGASGSATSTFQIVLATNGRYSYLILLFVSVEAATRIGEFIAISLSDGTAFSLPYSNDIGNVTTLSNVGTPGKYVIDLNDFGCAYSSMDKPDLETVLRTLHALYKDHPNDFTRQKQASKWLTDLQSSVYAWEIADQLLSLDTDTDYGYFAAQTIQTKVRHCFNELSADTHIPLRNSLLNHLTNHSKTLSPITKQLSLALADLALQMENWENIVNDCIAKFGSNMTTVPILLEILVVLPEEVNNRSLRLGENQRTKWKTILGDQCSGVLSMLSSCMEYWPNDEEIKIRVYCCLSSWVRLGTFPVQELANSSLIVAPFQTMHLIKVPHKLYEAAADCVCSALYICEELSKFGPLASVLQNQVNQLLPVFVSAIELEDLERANSLARVFTEMAESFLFHIVYYPDSIHGSIKTLDLLIHCAQHYDFEIVEMTFSVWYRLSEMVAKSSDKTTEERFRPYVAQFINALVKHCQINDDLAPTELPDDKDDFADFRISVLEVVRDTVFMIGSINCFQSLYNMCFTPGQSWVMTEACLFLMYAVAPSISRSESSVLSMAVPMLVSLPPDTCYAIRCTTLKLIGELSHWIGEHPDTLGDILKFIQDGFGIQCLTSYAAAAVQNLCHKCKGQLAHLFDGLLSIVQGADNMGMSNTAIIGLLTGSVEVLEGLPGDQISTGLQKLCLSSAQRLRQIIESDARIQVHSLNDPTIVMDRLATVFKTCQYKPKEGETHPALLSVSELWPLLCQVLNKYKSDARIVERVCRCIRFILRCLRSHAAPLLSPLVQLAVSIYREYHHSCFLYLGSIVADEFGTDPSCQSGLITMVEAFLEVSLPLLSGPGGLLENPDTIDDMFRLCARMVQRCPIAFLSTPVATTAFECAKASSIHMHREAFSSVMKFFKDLIHCPYEREDLDQATCMDLAIAVRQILAIHGQELINYLVQGFATLQTYMLAESTPVLWELLTNHKEDTLSWLEVATTQLQMEKPQKMTDTQKMEFLRSVQEAENVENLEDVARDFARLFR